MNKIKKQMDALNDAIQDMKDFIYMSSYSQVGLLEPTQGDVRQLKKLRKKVYKEWDKLNTLYQDQHDKGKSFEPIVRIVR